MKVICLFSGGLDSTVMLAMYASGGHDVRALSIDYGQRHHKEIAAATKIADILKVPHTVLEIPGLRTVLTGSALTDSVPVPQGHYADPSQTATIVPGRNLIFLAIAAGFAVAQDAVAVAIAAHAGDRAIYPDCRPEFMRFAQEAMQSGTQRRLLLEVPFLHLDKRGIVARGRILNAPLDLAWSCYCGGQEPCGRCGACLERAEATQ